MVDLNSEAKQLAESSRQLVEDGYTMGVQDQELVARYLAASERVEGMSIEQVVDVVRQGVELSIDMPETQALRTAARSVLLSFVLP